MSRGLFVGGSDGVMSDVNTEDVQFARKHAKWSWVSS